MVAGRACALVLAEQPPSGITVGGVAPRPPRRHSFAYLLLPVVSSKKDC